MKANFCVSIAHFLLVALLFLANTFACIKMSYWRFENFCKTFYSVFGAVTLNAFELRRINPHRNAIIILIEFGQKNIFFIDLVVIQNFFVKQNLSLLKYKFFISKICLNIFGLTFFFDFELVLSILKFSLKH